MKRGQTAIEFMILVGFVIFILVTFLLSLSVSMSEKYYQRQSLTIQNVARTIQSEIEFAHSTSDGYERIFKLPTQIISLDYQIDLVGPTVYVHTINKKHAISLPVKNVTGNFVPGSNRIRRANGIVYANS